MDPLYKIARPFLFQLDAEKAHDQVMGWVERAPHVLGAFSRATGGRPHSDLACEVGGLRFAGPVGLAAGLDKNGVGIPFWPCLGFGAVEVGTVTAHPQPGNPRPRLFRFPEEGALINRMGFNNEGSTALAQRLEWLRRDNQWPSVPVGVNVGKSKVTPVEPLDDAVLDYVLSVRRLNRLADYFTVNVSSPNTPELRLLQEPQALRQLIPAVLEAAAGKPVFIKFDPDLDDEALDGAVRLAVEEGVSGIIATNTTVRRVGLRRDPGEAGGLSGRPLWPLAKQRIRRVLDTAAGRVPVIGVGGIWKAEQAQELLDAGCAAVQIYSALVFEGPGLIRRINRRLLAEARRRRGA